MSTANVQSDQAWGALINETAEVREARMAQRYEEMVSQSEEERLSRMMAMVRAEYALADAELRVFTMSRLRTWLSLDEDTARKIATSYDAVMRNVPGQVAMRRVALVQTLARDFSRENQQRLVELVPGVFGGIKDILQPSSPRQTPPTVKPAEPAKRSRWPFRRG